MNTKTVDVAIIGGGIIGCAIAWYLMQRGLSVGVYEKGRIAGEQSSKNSGFVRKQGRDEREMPLIKRSLELWATIDGEIEAETGFAVTGNLAIAGDEEKLEAMRGWLKIAREFNVDSDVLTGERLTSVAPRLSGRYKGALYTPSDCRAEPFLAAPAIAAALMRRGADLRERCHVQRLIVEGGRVTGIVTEQGEVRAKTVVVAAGLWSGLFLARYGVDVPQSDLRISVGRTAPFDHGLTIPSWTPEALVRPRHDGGLTIALGMLGPCDFEATLRSLKQAGRFMPTYLANRKGVSIHVGRRLMEGLRWNRAYLGESPRAYEEIRVPDVPANTALLEKCAESATRDFSFDAPLRLVETWACRADMTPDGVPVIDAVSKRPGLVIATGMSGHGFGISLGVGEAVADLIDKGESRLSLAPFRLERFAERYFMAPQNVL